MGTVIKFVLILIIVLYLINKVGKFFYELFFPSRVEQQRAQSTRKTRTKQSQSNRQGDVHVSKEQSSKHKNFKGGDYVDFEEVE